MFSLDFLELLKKYKKEKEENADTLNTLKEIENLIENNSEKYYSFKNTFQEQELLQEIENNIIEKNTNSTSNSLTSQSNTTLQSDEDKIISYYKEWQKEFLEHGGKITPKCSQIITLLINTYYEHDFEKLTEIIKSTIKGDYQFFKNHLKNTLRAKMGDELFNYMESDSYKNLNIIKKFWKRKKITKVLKKIARYEFNKDELEEVIRK
jgi:hypothetical protein